MEHGTPFIIVAVAVVLAGCGYAAQGTPEHAASPTVVTITLVVALRTHPSAQA